MLLNVALGNPDTAYYILKHLLKTSTEVVYFFLWMNKILKQLLKIPTHNKYSCSWNLLTTFRNIADKAVTGDLLHCKTAL